MKILSELPLRCTEEHISRLVNYSISYLEIKNPELLEVVNIAITKTGTCIICKSRGSKTNELVFTTLTRLSNIYNSIWTPAICLDTDRCMYKNAVSDS